MYPFPYRLILMVSVVLVAPHAGWAQQISGFTQPFREIELACDESGSIAELHVREGDAVKQGDVLARLDDRVQRLQVETASHLASSTGGLEAARLGFEKRKMVNDRIRELIRTGHATESELIRAELEFTIAQSRFQAAKEETVTREIDLKRAELMLERRLIRAPFDGTVSIIHRRIGEFVSPVRPEVATLVDTHQLLAVFNVPSDNLETIRQRKSFQITMPDGKAVTAQIHTIGVATDAESGTVQVKLRIDNAAGQLRAGEQCTLQL